MCSNIEVSQIVPPIETTTSDDVMPENPPNTPTTTPTTTDTESTTPTVTATPVEDKFTYVRNNLELADYAIDFLEDETNYYNIIKSYTTEKRVALFILVNGLVSAAAHFDKDGSIHEYLRNDTPHKVFRSIHDWLNDFFDNSVSVNKILDSVHIGEDLVPIWMALIDAKEGDEMFGEMSPVGRTIHYDTNILNSILAVFGVSIVIASVVVPIILAFI